MNEAKLEVLAIIPARGGSKGVPKKNIKSILDKPLIAYTIEAAKKSKYITRVIVSTDDNEIADVSRQYGAEVPFLRPNELATDSSPTNDAILHVVDELHKVEGYRPKIICLLQCTSPLRDYNDIDETINKMLSTKSDAAVSICEVECNPYWTNVLENEKLKYFLEEGKNITRRQDLPPIYRINGAVYAVNTEVFLEQKTLEPENITGYIMDGNKSVDIDTAIDFKMAELLLKEKYDK
jgi:N-acylneuraminate cytidylyltransferase/CMP-N,N'-diacetyllegionaminic acid synthase